MKHRKLARPANDPVRVPSTRSLLAACMALGAASSAFAPAALAGTTLGPNYDPFHLQKANEGVATSVGSVVFTTFTDNNSDENFPRSGSASGVVLDLGGNNAYFLTSAHALAFVGRVEVESGDPMNPVFVNAAASFGIGNDLFTTNTVGISEWYVPLGYDGTIVESNIDLALGKLNISVTDLAAQGVNAVSIADTGAIAGGGNNFDVGTAYDGAIAELAGFGVTGDGQFGGVSFDGYRRWGQNRIEYGDSSGLRAPGGFITTDFDVDWDDDLYDFTPNDPTDRNQSIELAYAVDNLDEFLISGGTLEDLVSGGDSEARQVPERDFRVPFEYAVASGDSGGGLFVDGELVGLTTFGQVDLNGTGSFFTFDQGFLLLEQYIADIEELVTASELAGSDPLDASTVTLTSGNAWVTGATNLDPIVPIEEEDEEEETTPDANARLLVTYYSGFGLTPVEKMQLVDLAPLDTPTNLSDEEVLDLLNAPGIDDIDDAEDYLDALLLSEHGQPSVLKAQYHAARRTVLPIGPSVNPAEPPADRAELGDIDRDGDFDTDDAEIFINGVQDDEYQEWADFNEDGFSDDLDAVLYIQNLAGALMGDANLDGVIDQADLDAVLGNWGDPDAGWAEGDFGGGEGVDQFDLDLILSQWGQSLSPAPDPDAVPEPAGLAVVGLGLGLAAMRRRRQA